MLLELWSLSRSMLVAERARPWADQCLFANVGRTHMGPKQRELKERTSPRVKRGVAAGRSASLLATTGGGGPQAPPTRKDTEARRIARSGIARWPGGRVGPCGCRAHFWLSLAR